MDGLLDRIKQSGTDRRTFVGLAATVGVGAAMGLTGCSNKMAEIGSDGAPFAPNSDGLDPITGGKWVPFNCIANACAYRCYNRAYVVDGIMVRQGSDNTAEDTPDNPQSRGCLKGRSTRKIVTGVERLKYPMKRKNWQPGGTDFKPELRGIDEWERVSWDKAIEMIANEFTRIKEAYGNRAFLSLGQSEIFLGMGLIGSPILNAIGGCLTTWGQASQGGFPVVSRNMRGIWALGMAEASDRMALRHAKTVVFWGRNPSWSQSGGDSYHLLVSKKASGAKYIFVDPFLNPTMQALCDEWIPVRPGTDGALLEALAYEMITNNLHDQEFLDAHCVGFDAAHMPPNAKTNENFKDHILGAYDGIPKTPEWASTICGTPPDVIRSFAREVTSEKPVSWKSAGAPARTYYGNRYAQLFFTVGWMIGSVGTLGGDIAAGAGVSLCILGSPGGANLVACGGPGYTYPPNPICTETRANSKLQNGQYDPKEEYGITFAETFKAIVEGKYRLPGPSGAMRDLDVRCIVRDNAHQPANQQSGGIWAEKAFRTPTVEFILVQDRYLAVDAQYADIVLPVATSIECDFSVPGSSVCPSELAFVGSKVIEPYFESKPDPEIFLMLCDKLGIGEDVVPRITVRQGGFNKVAAATIAGTSPADREPLVTITEDDLKTLDVAGEPQQGRIPIQEFLANGIYHFERKEDDAYMNVYDKAFIEDPIANPIKTTSGKYEIYCQSLKDYYDLACFNDIDALPKYKASPDGYEQAKADPEYKYQMVSVHTIRQAHSTFANCKQLQEVFANDITMSIHDAEKSGLKKGDWVLASSAEGGKVVRRVNVYPHLMPGVVLLAQGNWRAINQSTGIDEGGNTNTLTRGDLLGDGYQSYNTVLLKIERYGGSDQLPDYKRQPIVPLSE